MHYEYIGCAARLLTDRALHARLRSWPPPATVNHDNYYYNCSVMYVTAIATSGDALEDALTPAGLGPKKASPKEYGEDFQPLPRSSGKSSAPEKSGLPKREATINVSPETQAKRLRRPAMPPRSMAGGSTQHDARKVEDEQLEDLDDVSGEDQTDGANDDQNYICGDRTQNVRKAPARNIIMCAFFLHSPFPCTDG
jgi:hypothetical protein